MDCSPALDIEPRGRQALWGAALAALTMAAALLASSPGVPMVWDEGPSIRRAEGIAHWCRRWTSTSDAAGPRLSPWSPQALHDDWRFTTQVEGHPAFYAIVIAAGRALTGRWLAPLTAARVGPILLFALASGVLFARLRRDYGLTAAVAGVAALMCQPRLWAHAHFATLDGPLSSCWILTWAAFEPRRANMWRATVWGIALGMTMSCKATGWLAPLPFLAWTALYRDRGGLRTLLVGLPAALLTFFVLNPPLWMAPVSGLAAFFRLNLQRAANPDLNISTQFLGGLYNLDVSLPWYNTLFWTAIAVPVGILLLALAGLGRVVLRGRREPQGPLIVLLWMVLLVARALPGVPPHDGIRLFLPSFAMLAALAGVGGQTLSQAPWPRRGGTRLAAVGLLLAGSATSVVWYGPHGLSYYNLAIGGLRGATALGMEPTYYWDGLDRRLLDWLQGHTPPGQAVRFAGGPLENLELLRQWDQLRFACGGDAADACAWYVVQHRPGAWQLADRWLIEQQRPALSTTIRPGGWGPWRLDVPLVSVFSGSQYAAACRAVPR